MKETKTALFWVVTQRVVVISYRRFGKTYRSYLQGSCLNGVDREIFNFAYMAKGEQIAKYIIPVSVDELHVFVSDSCALAHLHTHTHKSQLCLSYDLGVSSCGLVEEYRPYVATHCFLLQNVRWAQYVSRN